MAANLEQADLQRAVAPDRRLVRGRERRRDHELRWSHVPHLERWIWVGRGHDGTAPLVALNAVALSTATDGWAVGAAGALLRTVNGGAAWTKATSPTTRDLSAIAMSGSRGIAVGSVGTVLVTADGVNWSAAGLARHNMARQRSSTR